MSADPNSIGGRLHANGWRTGSVVTHDHYKNIGPLQRCAHPPLELNADVWLIVVSQTCDVVAPRLSQEPFVELLLATTRQKIDSNKAGLRSTRHLSFRASSTGPVLEAHATDRYWLPREMLDGISPDGSRTLSNRAIERLSEWLALRYSRAAWPNSLVKRLSPQMKAIEVLLSNVALEMVELRVAITDVDVELPDSKPYHLTIFGIADAEWFHANPEGRAHCVSAFQDLLSALRKCQGVVVEDSSEFMPGDQFDWQTTRMTHQWNFANLTDAAQDRA